MKKQTNLHCLRLHSKRFVWMMSTICFIGIASAQKNSGEFLLNQGWYIQSGDKVTTTGEILSTAGINMNEWIPAKVPSTVLGTLVDQGIYKDVYVGKNLDLISREQFKTHWWYRKEFMIANEELFKHARISFEGINYAANIWLNGVCIASADTTQGSFRIFNLDITKLLRKSGNAIAVQVFPPKPGNFTIGFVDWSPRPNDESMGLFRPVKIKLSGSVSINDPFVESKVNTETLQEGDLTISAMLTNQTADHQKSTVIVRFANTTFQETFDLQPNENRKIVFSPQTQPSLHVNNPMLWWPCTMGEPNLYHLSLQVLTNGAETDHQYQTFGIREITDYLTPEGYRGYKVNGKMFQIRGGGWADELLLREDPKNLEAQIRYAKQMHLNTIRLEGFWGCSQHLYDLCDQYGLLIMVGWSCHWEWPEYLGKSTDTFGGVKTPEDMHLVNQYLNDQVMMFRNHPSIFVWVVGSDDLPRPELGAMFLSTLKRIDPTRLILGSCKEYKSGQFGETGVKMVGPYDYVTPVYWYTTTNYDGPYGFNTETSPGPQIPPMESLKKMIPADSLWPLNDVWKFHCARQEFHTLIHFESALNIRYGKSNDANEFVKKSEVACYEAIRPMFEAVIIHKPQATGVVQWMLNASWPRLFWQLYDYYLTPGSAFFGTMKACSPLSIMYNYGDGDIYVSNELGSSQQGLSAVIKVYNLNSKLLFNKTISFDIEDFTAKKIMDMPQLVSDGNVYFIDLAITDRQGDEKANNFYWLSPRKDVIDETKTDWIYTPNKEYADFTSLGQLPETSIEMKTHFTTMGTTEKVTVELNNPSNIVAFFVSLKLKGKTTGNMILPVFWNDNYISLAPGESRTLEASFAASDMVGDEPMVEMKGWNVK